MNNNVKSNKYFHAPVTSELPKIQETKEIKRIKDSDYQISNKIPGYYYSTDKQ